MAEAPVNRANRIRGVHGRQPPAAFEVRRSSRQKKCKRLRPRISKATQARIGSLAFSVRGKDKGLALFSRCRISTSPLIYFRAATIVSTVRRIASDNASILHAPRSGGADN